MHANFNNDHFIELAKKWPSEVPRFLYKNFYHKLVHLAQQRTNNRQASEDIVQDIFIDVWRKLDHLVSKEGFLIAPYLLMMVKNKSITYFWKSTLIQPLTADSFDIFFGAYRSAEDEMLQEELKQQLRTWVDRLPTRERDTLKLKYFDGLANEIIADRLSISKKSVERRVTTGIRMLQRMVRKG